GHERTLVGAVGLVRRWLRLAREIAAVTSNDDGRPLLEDPHWQRRFAALDMRLRAHQMTSYRALVEQQKGRHPGPESSILKIVGTELIQRAGELCMEVMGHDALAWLPSDDDDEVPDNERWVAPSFCYDRAATIYAGSNEIQRNI